MVPQAAPVVVPVPVPVVPVPSSVAVQGKGGVSSYSAAALSTLKRRLGAGNRTVGGKRHKVCMQGSAKRRIPGFVNFIPSVA